jgi:hypothetical protein
VIWLKIEVLWQTSVKTSHIGLQRKIKVSKGLGVDITSQTDRHQIEHET